VPVDGLLHGDVVEAGGVRMEPAGDGWMLTEPDNRAWKVRPAEAKGAPDA
jgi:hypothetical protein